MGKAKRAAAKHGSRKACHDRLGLYGEISEEFVGTPTADKLDAVSTNDASAEQGHGASSPGGAGRDVLGGVCWMMRMDSQGKPKASAART